MTVTRDRNRVAVAKYKATPLSELEARWAKAQKAWNASGSTDHVKIIQLGEDLYFAASDLIGELEGQLNNSEALQGAAKENNVS